MALTKLSNWTGTVFIGGWVVGLSCLTASLMVGHWVTLPHPQQGQQSVLLAGQLANSHEHAAAPDVWVFHFLYGDCPCSRRIVTQIIQRSPIPHAQECIVFIGEDQEMAQQATARGYKVDCVTPELLQANYGVESAPLMMIVDNDANILYSGGYTARKQGLDNKDQQIICAVLAGESVPELPLYGCAVSQQLKQLIDPLGLKRLSVN